MSRLAFLGTGLMGGALAEAAAKRGHAVVAWNRTRAKALALQAHGVIVADSPAEACAQAERIHVVMPDDDAVESVLEACGDALRKRVIVDHTTASPARTRGRALFLAAEGLDYLHAPVFMSPQMCREAKGLMFVSGMPEVYEKVRAGLAEMTGTVRFLGERPDKAAAFKLAGNAALISLIAGFADILAMAAEERFDPAEIHGLFELFNPAASLAYRGKEMVAGRYLPASFEMTMARKDVRLMIETAGRRPLAVLPGIAARMDELIADGHGALDLGALSIDAVPPKNAP